MGKRKLSSTLIIARDDAGAIAGIAGVHPDTRNAKPLVRRREILHPTPYTPTPKTPDTSPNTLHPTPYSLHRKLQPPKPQPQNPRP